METQTICTRLQFWMFGSPLDFFKIEFSARPKKKSKGVPGLIQKIPPTRENPTHEKNPPTTSAIYGLSELIEYQIEYRYLVLSRTCLVQKYAIGTKAGTQYRY